MQRQLEKQLLETPLFSASVKYDGTSLGLLDTGELDANCRRFSFWSPELLSIMFS